MKPICPSFCRFNLLCNEDRQTRMNRLFVSGEARRPEDCIMYPGFARKLFVLYGVESENMTAQEVADAVRKVYRERKAS